VGIKPHEADLMDISVVADFLGVHPAATEAELAPAPLLDDGTVPAATAPRGIRPPKWWRGDAAAFRSSVAAQREQAETPGSMEGGGGGP
jgi:hypothetical protein